MISVPDRPDPAPCNTQGDICEIIDSGSSGHIGSVDWLRLSGPEADTEKALRVFSKYFPDPLDTGHGFGKYRSLHQASDSTAMFCSQNVNGGSWLIELQGDVCQTLTTPTLIKFYRELQEASPDVSATRLDIAIDLVGDVSQSIDALQESIESNAVLPGGRLLDPRAPSKPGSDYVGHGFYVGSHKSRMFLRVYDKGLQTKSRPKGDWIRWEVQFNKESAPWVLSQLLVSSSQDSLCSLAQGFFKNVDGPGRETWLRLGDEPTQVPTIKRLRTGDGFVANFKRISAPTIIQAAERLQTDPYELARAFQLFDAPPETLKRSPERERVVRDICLWYCEILDGSRPNQPDSDLPVAPH